MINRIFLCPGQGAQTLGMGKAWHTKSHAARQIFARADELAAHTLPGGQSLTSLCFDGPQELLNRTDVSQPALYTCGIACFRGLLEQWGGHESENANIAAAAGLSLGEYTALCIAGAITFEDGLRLVMLRGQAMQDAATSVPSGMVALIGADEAQAVAVCDEARQNAPGGAAGIIVPANFNAPGQIVLSGDVAAVARAEQIAVAKGLRATVLQVAGAFHSPIMQPAAARLAHALAATPINEAALARTKVFSNVTAQPHVPNAQSVRQLLTDQLTSSVRWAQSCAAMIAAFPGAELHEVAPGKTIAGLMRRIDKSAKVTSWDE
jgi:[acyl-carrier-protein] S-malonyltransferase